MYKKFSTLIAASCFGLLMQNGFAAPSAFTAEDILPNGVDSTISVNPYTGESGEARKGSMAAMVNNIALLNHLLQKPNCPEIELEIEAVVKAINHLIPPLRVVGVFNLFEPIQWIGSGEQPGRVLVAVLYLTLYPDEITPEILDALQSLSASTSSNYLKNLVKGISS